jgi:hypothetical protein
MTFNPSTIAYFLSCYKVNKILTSGGLDGIRVKKSQNVVPLLILIQFPEFFSASHDVAFGKASFSTLQTILTTAVFALRFCYRLER